MSSPRTIDIATLLAPIPGDNPAGENVRYEGVYDRIQEARRADDEGGRGEWQREIKRSDWNAVIKLATEALESKTKDLQIAGWLLEALVNRHGFAGLRDGIHLVRELQEKFWDTIYPVIEDGDLEFRGGILNWLNESLPLHVSSIPLTGGNPAYSWGDWDESRKVDNLGRSDPQAKQAAIEKGKIAGETFDKAAASTGRAFYEDLVETMVEGNAELEQLKAFVYGHFGQSVSLLKLEGISVDCHRLAAGILKQMRAQDPTYSPDGDDQPEAGSASQGSGHGNQGDPRSAGENWAGEPRNRDEAFQRLTVLAAYLKRVEPQHPVSFLLERAVRWTKMPLDQWLSEVISNEDVLNQLRDTLGTKNRGG